MEEPKFKSKTMQSLTMIYAMKKLEWKDILRYINLKELKLHQKCQRLTEECNMLKKSKRNKK